MNFIFVSPHFPNTYFNFCDRLKRNQINVLGIGDKPYNELDENVKNSLNEYYYVSSMQNYDEMYKAVAYFAYKYGKIDYLESNNEFWLRQDAKLRTDFNINGAKTEDVLCFTSKSKMKDFYTEAGVPVARYKFSTNYSEDLDFITNVVEFPVIVKPDVGVGAYATYRLSNENDLKEFHNKGFSVPYIIEEYIEGDIVSFDGICDSNSNVVFCDNEVFPPSIMDIVNMNLEQSYYVNKEVPNNIFDIGQRVIKAFKIKSRYFHLEFFKLHKEKKGLGKAGDIVALEVNMRPPGGYTPDMINFSQSVDTYQIYADIIAYDKIKNVNLNYDKYFCFYFGRRNRFNYKYDYNYLKSLYNSNIVMHGEVPYVLSDALGNEFYMAKFETLDELNKFKSLVEEKY